MKISALFILFTITVALAEDAALQECPLPDVKGSIQIPEGWKSTQENDDGVFVYHLNQRDTPEQGESITLSVTTKVPERTEQSPSEYAMALMDMSQEEGNSSSPQKGTMNGFPSLRVEYDVENDSGKMRAVNIALTNDKTGTLYFFAWQFPVNESAEMKALREKVIASAKFDPAF